MSQVKWAYWCAYFVWRNNRRIEEPGTGGGGESGAAEGESGGLGGGD
jgi:hypothetical protein